MNYIESREKLKDISDNDVVNYYHNPTPDVPMFLALSELQRRKRLRDSYQTNKPEDKTVAEDLVQEAQPQPGIMGLPEGQPMQQAMQPPPEMPMEEMAQGGLAELDTGDMYDENNYASGGIVAFQKGGYSYSPDYDPVEQYRRARQLGEENLMSKRYNMPTTSVTSAGIETPYDASLSYYQDLRNEAAKSGKGLPELTSTVNTLQERRKAWLSGSLDPYTQTSPVGSKPNMEGLQKPVVSTPKASNEPDVKLSADTDTKQKGQPGVGFDGSFYDKMLGKEKTLKELSDEYKAVLGTDPTLAARQERLAKMDAKAAKMEEQAPWLALAKAGFEMASSRPEYGKGQSAIADIARGAGVGVKDYAESIDRLNTLEEKRFVLDTELAKQQRAEQVAAVTYGVNSRQHTEEINKTIMLAKAKDKLSRDVANLEAGVALSKAGATTAPKIKDIAEARASYQGSEQQKEVKKSLLKTLGDNADKPSSPRHKEYLDGLRLAEEQYLANYFAPIGSNIPTASTEGFKIKK